MFPGDEIVTLQVHDIEGVRDGVVHIVPQDQFYSMKEDGGLCKDEEPTSPVSTFNTSQYRRFRKSQDRRYWGVLLYL